jgi:predicted metal-dependent TIM-barrel fold hydrolase
MRKQASRRSIPLGAVVHTPTVDATQLLRESLKLVQQHTLDEIHPRQVTALVDRVTGDDGEKLIISAAFQSAI